MLTLESSVSVNCYSISGHMLLLFGRVLDVLCTKWKTTDNPINVLSIMFHDVLMNIV